MVLLMLELGEFKGRLKSRLLTMVMPPLFKVSLTFQLKIGAVQGQLKLLMEQITITHLCITHFALQMTIGFLHLEKRQAF